MQTSHGVIKSNICTILLLAYQRTYRSLDLHFTGIVQEHRLKNKQQHNRPSSWSLVSVLIDPAWFGCEIVSDYKGTSRVQCYGLLQQQTDKIWNVQCIVCGHFVWLCNQQKQGCADLTDAMRLMRICSLSSAHKLSLTEPFSI